MMKTNLLIEQNLSQNLPLDQKIHNLLIINPCGRLFPASKDSSTPFFLFRACRTLIDQYFVFIFFFIDIEQNITLGRELRASLT